MSDKKMFLITVVMISCSIIFSGTIIVRSINNLQFPIFEVKSAINQSEDTIVYSQEPQQTNDNTTDGKFNPDKMDLSEAAQYIGVYGDDLQAIIADKNSNIPYLKNKQGVYIFNKKALDKWMEKSYEMK